jgi:hypothetical protein
VTEVHQALLVRVCQRFLLLAAVVVAAKPLHQTSVVLVARVVAVVVAVGFQLTAEPALQTKVLLAVNQL